MTPFQRKSEEAVDARRDRQPSYITGLMVSTRDVVQDALKNPWFLSTRQMSPIYGDTAALLPDWNKDGISVVGPDYERPESRKPWTYVGVLIPGIQGTDSGKLEAFSTQNTHNYLHMVVNRKETPTGVRVEQRHATGVINTNTEHSAMDVDRSAPPAMPNDGNNPINPFGGDLTVPNFKGAPQVFGMTGEFLQSVISLVNGTTRTQTTVSQLPSLVPPNMAAVDINEKGQKLPTKATNTGSLGSRIETGTMQYTEHQLKGKIGGLGKGIK